MPKIRMLHCSAISFLGLRERPFDEFFERACVLLFVFFDAMNTTPVYVTPHGFQPAAFILTSTIKRRKRLLYQYIINRPTCKIEFCIDLQTIFNLFVRFHDINKPVHPLLPPAHQLILLLRLSLHPPRFLHPLPVLRFASLTA